MPRSDEAEFWINAVYAAVQEVPIGKVTTYGHIALLLGQRKHPSDSSQPQINYKRSQHENMMCSATPPPGRRQLETSPLGCDAVL